MAKIWNSLLIVLIVVSCNQSTKENKLVETIYVYRVTYNDNKRIVNGFNITNKMIYYLMPNDSLMTYKGVLEKSEFEKENKLKEFLKLQNLVLLENTTDSDYETLKCSLTKTEYIIKDKERYIYVPKIVDCANSSRVADLIFILNDSFETIDVSSSNF